MRHDADRGRELADVAGRVLRAVKEKPEHRGRQSIGAHFARVEERCVRRAAKLIDRAIGPRIESLEELRRRDRLVAAGSLERESGPLRFREWLATRIREQAIERSRGVQKMEPRRCSAAGPRPQGGE